MLVKTGELLNRARAAKYAVGAFNIYNLEGAMAVVQAAEELQSPVILQMLPSALGLGGRGLVAMCLEMARTTHVPVSVHLDHCSDPEMIKFALESGFCSVMADGSELSYEANVEFTRTISQMAARYNAAVEAELGKLSGDEDGISIDAREAQLTDVNEAVDFIERTKIDALAVCIGNVHGKYHQPPELDFERLTTISQAVSIPLVLHGTSGLPDHIIQRAIEYGVCKFNVNTEVRSAYVQALTKRLAGGAKAELVELMELSISAMKEPVKEKITLFCSANKTF